jgi:protein TonB
LYSRLLFAGSVSVALHAAAVMLLRPVALHEDAIARPAPLYARIATAPLGEAAPPEDVLKNTLRETPAPVHAGRPAPEAARHGNTAARSTPEKSAPEKSAPDLSRAQTLSQAELDRTLARVAQTLFYPPEAVARGLEGEVVVAIEVDAAGQIVAATVAAGSGHAVLDDAALRAVQRVGRLPGVAGRTILLPVRFSLL